ncbi:methionyl-tRNA formyltransferase [Desulfatirhabdium butyrativorans]|uniref:methionyl-tRNA formyltransferase n=1 Tax=Desulfatirhabdium butyrativorans TaxID=340467 RepID=UPI00041256EE|nr:methionyl-tRNA formyltransferase [Desulfatirhabdium butyrativorans]
MHSSCRIVFMGTPEFAVPSLKALAAAGHRIVLAVTQPDRPAGRGRKLEASAVKRAALEMGIPVFQPKSIHLPESVRMLSEAKADLFVVAAFGQILKPVVLSIPAQGAINVHASLLPRYRGPAPVQWAIIRREAETGVTIMQMNEGLDTGDVLSTATVGIDATDTGQSLLERLSHVGADLLVETIRNYDRLKPLAVAQDHTQASYAPMLKKSDGRINWAKSAEDIDALIRGTIPWPGAYTSMNGKRLKVFRAKPETGLLDAPPGTVLRSPSDELWIAAANRPISLLEVQIESGRRMPIGMFLKGHPVPAGLVLS